MWIRYVGPRVKQRAIGQHIWGKATGYVQEVSDAGLAAELLTEPSGDFVVDDSDPLMNLKSSGQDMVTALALAGIGSAGDLAILDDIEVRDLASRVVDLSVKQVRTWRRQLRQEQEVEEL